MNILKCSECGGQVDRIGNILRCRECKREKTFKPKDTSVHEVDMNDKTKDMDVILE